MNKLKKYLNDNIIFFETDVSLIKKTWIKRGGVANIWIQPNSISQLILITRYLYINKLNFEVIGASSNCYFTKGYNPNILISTTKVIDFIVLDKTIVCGCGYNVMRLSKYAVNNGIAGYEGFISLPGTIGGATINNSGCYGSIMENIVKSIQLIKPDGTLVRIPKRDLNYSHRHSSLKTQEIKGVLISVELDTSKRNNPNVLKELSEENKRLRKKTQENNYPNLGSIHSELVLWKDNRKLAVFFYKIIFKLLSVTNHINKRKYLNYYTFLVFNQPYLAKYVSDKNINCFIWKNPDISDKVFFKYLDCIKKNSKHSKVEIEIKKTECF